jgi:hypothetical protein
MYLMEKTRKTKNKNFSTHKTWASTFSAVVSKLPIFQSSEMKKGMLQNSENTNMSLPTE